MYFKLLFYFALLLEYIEATYYTTYKLISATLLTSGLTHTREQL